MKKLLIFDLDGTLIDSANELAAAVNAMLTRLQLSCVDNNMIKSWVGNGSHNLATRALNHHGQDDATAISAAHEIFLEEYAKIASDTSEYTGVSDGLKALKVRGLTLALCTNKPERFLPAILKQMAWTDLFDIVLGGDSLPTKKPDPAPLLHICQTLDIAIDDAAMIGDSKNDILAGQACGMTTLALRYGYNYGEPIDLTKPDYAFDDFNELVAYVLKSA